MPARLGVPPTCAAASEPTSASSRPQVSPVLPAACSHVCAHALSAPVLGSASRLLCWQQLCWLCHCLSTHTAPTHPCRQPGQLRWLSGPSAVDHQRACTQRTARHRHQAGRQPQLHVVRPNRCDHARPAAATLRGAQKLWLRAQAWRGACGSCSTAHHRCG